MSELKKTILVVDDEQPIRLMLRTALESEGFSIQEACSASEAIELIEDDAPALVLLDLWMPGENGMSVLEHLSHRPPAGRPAVIALTAHGGIPHAVQAMRLGAADFLEKPASPQQLRQSALAALKGSQSGSSPAQPPTSRPAHPDVSYSPTLVLIQQAVWKSDINLTEQILTDCLRRAATDPTFFNVVGVVFEAQGNLQTAKTFYQKAEAIPGGYKPASQNLARLAAIGSSERPQCDASLGDHARFIEDICSQTHCFRAATASASVGMWV
jgi:CheY-like chemotaxis protein